MNNKTSASDEGTRENKAGFIQLSRSAYAHVAEGDRNTGIVAGDDAVMVIDPPATPEMAQEVIRNIRDVSDKPIRYLLFTHYHAVNVRGISAYGARHIIASRDTYDLIAERGHADSAADMGRLRWLVRALARGLPDAVKPTMTFSGTMHVQLGSVEVALVQPGRGHTKGDTIAWLPGERVLFAGDLVETGSTPCGGDGYFREWPCTLEKLAALDPKALVPGHGPALTSATDVNAALRGTRAFVSEMWQIVRTGVEAGKSLKAVYTEAYEQLKPAYGSWVAFEDCMPFDVTRCYDEATSYPEPRIWTAERDRRMWQLLEG